MNINNIKATFGYLGFMPFAFLSITPWVAGGQLGNTAIVFQLGYGAVIISFLGGMSWGWRDNQANQPYNLFLGIIFSLSGCVILLLTYFNNILLALLVSVIIFQSFYHFEKSSEDFLNKDDDYKKFRKILSLLVSISFLISSAYWINPYSNPLT